MEINVESLRAAFDAQNYITGLAIDELYDAKPTWSNMWARVDAFVNVYAFEEALAIAEPLAKQAIKKNQWAAFCKLGSCYRAIGKHMAAARSFEQASDANPNEATPLVLLGSLHARMGDLPIAEQVHRRATQLTEGDIDEAWFNLGLVLRAQGRFEEAIAAFGKSMDIYPDERVLTQLTDIEAAVEFRNQHQALIDHINSAGPVSSSSLSSSVMKDFESVLRQAASCAFSGKAIVLSQIDPHLYCELAEQEHLWEPVWDLMETFWCVALYDQAESFFRTMSLGDEDDAWGAHAQLSRMNVYRGKFDEAERHFRQVIAEEPENQWGYEKLGEMLVETGRHKEAEAVLKEGLILDSSHVACGIWHWLGCALRAQFELEEAAEAFSNAGDLWDSEKCLSDLEKAIELLD